MKIPSPVPIHKPTLTPIPTPAATIRHESTPTPSPIPTAALTPRVQTILPAPTNRVKYKPLEDPYKAHNITPDPYQRTKRMLPVRPIKNRHNYFTQSRIQGFLAQ